MRRAAARLVGVSHDVTARRESEAKLRRSEQLLRATTSNTADTLLLVDTDLRHALSIAAAAICVSRRSSGARSPSSFRRLRAASVVAKLRHVFEYRRDGNL